MDALLSIEYRDAAKHKVQLRLDLCDLERFPLRDTELVTVMCNLLDNAIRAAEGTEAFLRIWFHRAMSLDLCDLERFPLRDTELVTVMCNLLDNAIRAAEGTEAFLRIWFHRAMIDPREQKAL